MLLEKKLKELVHLVDQLDKQNTNISIQPVGWHIDHALKVVIKTCEVIKKSNPDDYKWHFNFFRLVVFTTGSFARGSAKAPKSVVADRMVTAQAISEQFQQARSLINEVAELPVQSNFTHPYFGMLALSGFCRFQLIHTNHHLKIIKDIIGKDSKR